MTKILKLANNILNSVNKQINEHLTFIILILIIIIILLIIVYIYVINNYNLKLNNNISENFSENNDKIPLNIFQTWHNKELPSKMNETVETLKRQNSEFTYHIYTMDDCIKFINDNFDKKVLNAYNRLIPLAYKADLWRYCILYKYGGIYLDIKYSCVDNFKLIKLTDREHFVKDRPEFFRNKDGIYQALLITKPNNKLLLECINKIVENVNNNYYGFNALEPTGPGLIGSLYDNFYNDRSNIDLKFIGDGIITDNLNNKILIEYPEYRNDLKLEAINSKIKNYNELWDSKKIYKQM